MLIARRKKGEEKQVQIKIVKVTGLRLNSTQGLCYPWIKIQHGREAVATIATVVHDQPFVKSTDISYNAERRLPLGSWNKLIIRLEDDRIEIARVEISLRNLCRGIKHSGWYELQPAGRISVELVATNFGKIAKPEINKRTPTMHLAAEEQFFQTVSSGQPPQTRGFKEYKTGHIKRQMPHVAQGSFGIVYRGTVKEKKEEVAIKDIKVTSFQMFEEWKKEVEFMGQHKSPYIVEIFGYCAKTSILTIVMEWMENGDLFNNIHKKKPSASKGQRLRWARHCALGVAFLHANKILHRDIKSMNILISKDNVAKHADFGCARILATNEQAFYTAAKGSLLWMAPEVRLGKAYNLSADNFSLGVVLYELFEALPEYDHQKQSLVLPSYDFGSCGIVMPLLNWNQERRPSARQVAHQLNMILQQVIMELTEGDAEDLDATKYDTLLSTSTADALIQAKLFDIKKEWMHYQKTRRAANAANTSNSTANTTSSNTTTTGKSHDKTDSVSEISRTSSKRKHSTKASKHPKSETSEETEDTDIQASSCSSVSDLEAITVATSPIKVGKEELDMPVPVATEPIQQIRPQSSATKVQPSMTGSATHPIKTLLYDFEREPISLKKADRVRVISQQGPWLDVLTADGKRGWIPTSYAQ